MAAVITAVMIIDCLQYVAPSETVFRQMREGSVDAVHMTVGYHEDFLGVVQNLQDWNAWFERFPDLIHRATTAQDILDAKAKNKTAIMFGLQNPLAIGADLGRIEILHQLGIRFCQITYNQQSLLGAGCFEPVDSGLTAFGREAVSEMNRVGMVVDLSHAGHHTAMDVIAHSHRPVTVTHANPYQWHAAPRNLQPELIKALAQSGGMMGFSLYPHHLADGSDCSMEQFSQMVMELIADHGADMFGFGSDLCQGQPDSVVNWMRNGHWRKVPVPAVAFPDQPKWFKDNRDYPDIAKSLVKNGISSEDVDGIMGKNWMRFIEAAFKPDGKESS